MLPLIQTHWIDSNVSRGVVLSICQGKGESGRDTCIILSTKHKKQFIRGDKWFVHRERVEFARRAIEIGIHAVKSQGEGKGEVLEKIFIK